MVHRVKTFLHCLFFLGVFLGIVPGVLGQSNEMISVLLQVPQSDYARVARWVESLGGHVQFQYRHVSGMAVEIPAPSLTRFAQNPSVKGIYKDLEWRLPEIPKWEKLPGAQKQLLEASPDFVQEANLHQWQKNFAEPENYYPLTDALINAIPVYQQTGHFGEGIIVGIMDSGVSEDAVAVASRIVGGENFTDDGVSATSGLNNPHGTWVACCVGANAIFGFANKAIQNAVKRYCPDCVIPNYFGNGIDGIPMVGVAPAAQFYSLKIFRTNGTTSNSIILAAMDRAIELKEKYNRGEADGVNLQVLNMSFGGISLYAGEDPFFAQLVEQMDDVGIVVVASAGNAGPSGITGGDPGLAENILTVGASDPAVYERIVMDIFFLGAGGGMLVRPLDNHLIANFSSRGPTADGRHDPEVVAPGKWRFVQHANGHTINWVSGTSFSAPTVAGVAALLLSIQPSATPDQIRGAILNGANPSVIQGKPTASQDQGFGLVDALGAYHQLLAGAPNPPDAGPRKHSVATNIFLSLHQPVLVQDHFSTHLEGLEPGERKEFFLNVGKDVSQVIVRVKNLSLIHI